MSHIWYPINNILHVTYVHIISHLHMVQGVWVADQRLPGSRTCDNDHQIMTMIIMIMIMIMLIIMINMTLS